MKESGDSAASLQFFVKQGFRDIMGANGKMKGAISRKLVMVNGESTSSHCLPIKDGDEISVHVTANSTGAFKLPLEKRNARSFEVLFENDGKLFNWSLRLVC